MYAPPITGLGIVAMSAPIFPTKLISIRRIAPVRTTQREATPVNPIRPIFSVYDVVATAPRVPAIAQFKPSAPIPLLIMEGVGSGRPAT